MKNLKFLTVIAVLFGMVGCSSDDFRQANENYELAQDGSEVFVTVGAQEGAMRAGFANEYNTEKGTIKQLFLWAENDVFKMYCTDTWKPQLYKFKMMTTVNGVNGTVFTWAEDGSKYNKGTDPSDMTYREYAVFPAKGDKDGNLELKFTDELRTALTMTIPTPVDYGKPEKVKGEYVYAGNIEDKRDDVQDWMYVSNTLVPLFGFAIDNTVSFKYMTALLRVNVQGIATGRHTLTLKSNTKKLSGEFKTEDFDAAKYETTDLPKFKAEDTEIEGEKSLTIAFEADNENLGTDYFIYIPVPVGTYAAGDLSLKLDEDVEDGDKREITITTTSKVDLNEQETTVEAGTFLVATTSKPVVKYVSSLKDLQDVVAEFKDVQRETTYHIWGGSAEAKEYFNIAVPELYLGGNLSESTLAVPELKAPVTVYLHGAFTAEATQNNKTLYITGVEQGEKLTLNVCDNTNCTPEECDGEVEPEFSASTANIEIEKIPAIELDGTFEGGVKIDGADVTIGGEFGSLSLNATQQLSLKTLTADIETSASIVNILGTVTGDITGGMTTTNVTIAKDAQLLGKVTAPEAALVVNGAIGTQSQDPAYEVTCASAKVYGPAWAEMTTTGDVEIDNDGYVRILKAKNVAIKAGANKWYWKKIETEGDVTVETGKDTKELTTVIAKGNVTIADNNKVTSSLTVESGKVTMNGNDINIKTLNLNEGSSVEVNGGVIETLNDNAGSEIVMTAGNIKAITVAKEKKAEITTSGAATIEKIDGESDITATWNEATTNSTATANNGEIYTAAQLAALQGSVTGVTEVTLYANVKAADNYTVVWTPSDVLNNKATEFDGQGHKISGVTVKKDYSGSVGFFTRFSNSSKVTVKNLTLENISVSTKATNATYNIGGLVGLIESEASIENVHVSGTTIGSAESGKINRVGGLIGTANSKVDIKNSSVDFETIYGWMEVGGLIGSVGNSGGAGEVTVSVDNKFEGQIVKVGSFVALNKDAKENYKNYGRIGMLVGVMTSADSKFVASEGIKKENVYNSDILSTDDARTALGFDNNTYVVESNIGGVIVDMKYVGQAGHYVGYSPNYNTTGNVKVLTTEYTTEDTDAKKGLNVYQGTARNN